VSRQHSNGIATALPLCRHAEPLAHNPTHSHSDKTTRYDVYVRPLRREDA
jgi:hypothetical protein